MRSGRQHAERQHVDLENAERIEIVLVPFDRGAALHRRRHDRRDFVEAALRDDEAAGMLRQVAREASISCASASALASRGSSGSMPRRSRFLDARRLRQRPQIAPDSAACTSSGKPIAFAVCARRSGRDM